MTDTAAALGPLLARLAETARGLRVETGPGTAGRYAYDASNYRVPPRAVAFPRSADDVVAVVRACREAGVPVTARGGGTSMAGNAVGPGVVLDFSRYMNRILDIDPDDTDAVLRVARPEADVRRLIGANLAAIRTELGRIPRQVSGYQLHHLLPEHGFDMARAPIGTEGSCAVVTAATVRLVATAQASGFSCATQIGHLAGDQGIRALHLAGPLDPVADRSGEIS